MKPFKAIHHRNGDVTLKLNACEAAALWGLIREGRRAHAKEYAAYDSTWALDLMTALQPNPRFVSPTYVRDHIARFG